MSNLNILIVEDSPVFATELEMLVRSIGYLPIAVVDNSEEALSIIYKEEPDLILMDIDIKGDMTGIELAEKINHLEIPILFITSYDDRGIYERAKRLSNHVNFLVKPLNEITLRSNIELTLKNLSQLILGEEENEGGDDFVLNNCFFIKKSNALLKVPIDDITLVESDGNYCRIYSKNQGSFFLKNSLSKITSTFPGNQFLRIHRKYLINAKYIEQIELSSNEIKLDGSTMPIGRKYKDVLLEKLQKLS